MKNTRTLKGIAVSAAALLALTACSGGDEGDGGGDAAESKDVTIAVFNGWDEGIAASELWKNILEGEGYDVTLEYADAAPVFQGLSDGDYDVTLDGWLPLTHAEYVDEYGDEIVDYGAWNDEAKLTIAVNSDAPVDSLEELADNADVFNNRLVGIEPGAGLTTATEDSVIPSYGLEDMEFLTSSTPAMLSELDTATENGENIAVTLWRPHWAYDAYDIKDLEDPEGALGDAEEIHAFGSTAFSEANPEVVGWLEDFEMDSETLHSLENVMFNENDTDDYAPIVEDWIAENQDYVDGLTS
ncbi:glycine betaine ABC transporter substrate-binding protein [Zhihengliuella salsuginis]|uniref:Glycine/betaine ABC transporter substrate-binding protein n=1 Tax=Zhihengliuella salsuginis TaxID=578222 RepID=A0ABQ3GLY7_9MICC|nr:glycine betaine ABC transporter substrate-binding protein [Zhihengliuella salsuginis]GHD11057.1 glycine/betaine ABC transporter substrate-binding protein [Zhihengliuella salsuginis]